MKILIAEDNSLTLKIIQKTLEKKGFEVIATGDGMEAVQKIEEHSPEVVILDIMMPGMDGFELCKHIRERTATSTIPILMLSTRGDAESVMRGMDAGASDYLPKPILHHDLVAKVRTLLDPDTIID